MTLGQFTSFQSKPWRAPVMLSALLAAMLSISACQQEPEPDSSLSDEIAAEESVPMSADPADPNDVVAIEDPELNEVQDDTIANVNKEVTQFVYLCSPELEVETTYKDEMNQAVLVTDQSTLTLDRTNMGTNPAVYEVQQGLDGGEGFTQWREAHERRDTGVIRTAGADSEDVTTYECKKVE